MAIRDIIEQVLAQAEDEDCIKVYVAGLVTSRRADYGSESAYVYGRKKSWEFDMDRGIAHLIDHATDTVRQGMKGDWLNDKWIPFDEIVMVEVDAVRYRS